MADRRRLSSVGRAWRPLGGLLGPAVDDASQSLGALAFSATTSLITGFTFAAVTDTLRTFPGLLLFIPAAIGLRGNVFGPLGSRLSTAIRAGTFTWSWKPDSLLGQNVIGWAMASSLAAAVGLAAIAEFVAVWLRDGEASVIGVADFVVVSVFGGTLASIVVLAITIGLAVASARFGWDLDNVTAPLVSASGDFVTLPAIVLATFLIQRGAVTRWFAVAFVVVAGGRRPLHLPIQADHHPASAPRIAAGPVGSGHAQLGGGGRPRTLDRTAPDLLGAAGTTARLSLDGRCSGRHPLESIVDQGSSRPCRADTVPSGRGTRRHSHHLHAGAADFRPARDPGRNVRIDGRAHVARLVRPGCGCAHGAD